MAQLTASALPAGSSISPMVLAHRLLALAEDADRAGFVGTAERLLRLAHSVFDETPAQQH
jgi:hypothetical protein